MQPVFFNKFRKMEKTILTIDRLADKIKESKAAIQRQLHAKFKRTEENAENNEIFVQIIRS